MTMIQHQQEPTSVEHTSVSSTIATSTLEVSLTEGIFSGALAHNRDDIDSENVNVNDLKSNISNDIISGNEAITILGEIVGAYQLERDDVEYADGVEDEVMHPYAQVRFGDAVIHKTKPAVERGRNPIWTISTGSLFLWQGTPIEFAKHGSGLQVSF
jgi:hypothetical protein